MMKRPLMGKTEGFTLIEVMIVAVITILLTTALVTNFSKTRSELPRAAAGVVNDIRSAQNRAVSGVLHEGLHRCGYGVFFEANQYTIFAGPPPDPATGCAPPVDNFIYDPGEEVSVIPLKSGLQFRPEGDVYFVPPLPTTYVNGVSSQDPRFQDLTINLQEPGATCPSPGCRIITINAAGQIQSQ